MTTLRPRPQRFSAKRESRHLTWLACLAILLGACTKSGGGGGSAGPPGVEPPTLEFQLDDEVTLGEAALPATIQVQLSAAAEEDVELSWTLQGDAVAGEDFQLPAGPLVIPAGELTAEFEIVLLDDNLDEPIESVTLLLEAASGFDVGAADRFTLHIEDDDPEPSIGFSVGEAGLREGDGVIDVELSLSAPSGRSIRFELTQAGAATAGEDYSLHSGPFVIESGESSLSIELELLQDTEREQPELLALALDALDAVHIDPDRASSRLTILDDDGPVSNSIDDALIAYPLDLSFNSVRIGTVTAPQTIQVTNGHSEQAVEFRRVHVAEDARDIVQLTHATPLPLELLAGAATSFDFAWTPLEVGPLETVLELRQLPSAMPLTRVRALGGAFGPTGAEYLLNAASSPYQHGNGEEWIADWRHVGNSSLIQTGSSIDGTVEDDLYRSARIGNLFGYRLELPAGDYLLQLHFADWTATSAGERVFDVFVEGLLAINDIDLVAAGGTASAHVESLEVAVNDGILNLDLVGNIGVATISAVEVRSIPRVAAAPNLIDFAVVEQGQFDQRDVVLTNTGLHEAVLDRLSFDLDAGGFGSGLDFSVEIDGQVYAGANQTIEHAIELTIPAGSNRSVSVLFEPTAHIEHELQLRFEGELGSTEVRLSGLGGAGGGWGYLHPIALVDPALLVDYDADGSESVHLTAEASHTHENGHQIVAYEWSDASGVLSTQAEFDYVATAATQSLTLEIFDDHVPALSATLLIELIMHPRETVPGVLVHIFDAEGGNPADWLDALPAQPHYTERGEYLLVRSSSGSIGGSPYAAGVLVQLAADFQVDATDTYEFEMSGGADSRLDIDGQVLQGSGTLGLTLVPGTYRLDARYAVDHISELPLACDVRVGGQPAPSFADGLRYDASEAVPVLHNMDSQGSTAGGQLVSLLGFGFYPAAEVTVEWGQLSLGGGSPLLLESVEPGMIQLRTPPGDAAIAGGASTGTIAVRVTTPAGSSHSFDFEYLPEGPVDIQFALQPTLTVPVSEPTALLWGPDGRLWVGAMTGELTAITYDAQWNATQVDTYSGVSSLTNPEILGLAFDPWQPGGPLQITVSHNLLAQFNNGPPTGPADYTGQVSTIAGPDFDNPVSLIKRLPVSNHDHGVNAVVYDNNGDLLIAVGGCTNAGVPHSLFGFLSDSPLSGAILKARTSSPSFQGALSYRNRSDDIENNDLVFGETVYLAPGSDVEIHTPGIRNAFDLCLATWGYLYAADNGPNEGYGFGSTGLTTDDGIQASTQFDELNLIERDNWYGYANRNRGFDDARQYVYQGENVLSQAEVHTGPIGLGASSANGLIEYRSDTFGGALRGQLLAQKYFGRIKRHQLSSDRRDAVLGNSDLPVMPALNLEMGPGGVIIATHYLGNVIKLMTPVDASANGATVYDITPWRALAAGGDAFVIGGVNLGSMATTSVTIGGLPATLSSVSSTRIHGTIPSNPAPTQDLVHVVVTVNGLPRTHHNSFMWLPNAKGQWLGTWRESASLLQALGSVSAGVSDKWLLAVGDSVPNTYAYDLLSGGWTGNRAPRPFPTSQHSAHVVAGKLLLFGGTGASQGKVQIYDPVADSWSLGTDMPWTGRAVASAFQGGMVYVMGGLVGSQTVGDHALYDPATDMWTPLPAMDAGLEVCFAAGGSDGHYVYVIGGRAGDGSPAHGFDFVQRYDPATSSWDTSEDAGSVLAPMPKGRSGTGSALWYQNELCIFGGETSDTDNDPDATVDGVYPQVQCWNPGTGVWRNEALMPTARHGTSPVLFQGRAFLVGGGVENGSSNSTTVEVFDRQ